MVKEGKNILEERTQEMQRTRGSVEASASCEPSDISGVRRAEQTRQVVVPMPP